MNWLRDKVHYSLLLLFVLVSYFWLPALWNGQIYIHGDSAHHGLSLVWLHVQALAGHDTLLWSSRIYGGHPLFAEGQGGYANPLNIVAAAFFEPVHAIGFLHWATILVGGGGVFCLCRTLGISGWSATFAAIAVVFSSAWLSNQHDLPAFVTLAWIPWLIAAAEYWLKQPSLIRAAVLAIPAALLVFAGYPQMTHGAALYVLISMLAQFFQQDTREEFIRRWRVILVSGMLAVILAIGLAAIQFLPLIELVGQSYRQHGIQQIYDFGIPPLYYFRGLLYFYLGTDINGIGDPGLSNMAVLMLAGILAFFRLPPRILGQLLGTFLLFNLAMGATSPLFRVAYEYHLIPGLHYFRTMLAYSTVAVVGFAVIAAYALDVLSGPLFSALHDLFQRYRNLLLALVVAYCAGLLWFFYEAYSPLYSKWAFFAPILLVLSGLVLAFSGQRKWLPTLAVLILVADALGLRMHPYVFFDRKILERPDVMNFIAAEAGIQSYRTMSHSVISSSMVFLDPADPVLPQAYRRSLEAMNPFPMAMLWKIPSINGVTGLPLARRNMLDPVFLTETIGTETNRPGLRLMDILGVRYISVDGLFPTPGLHLHWQDQSQALFIMKNDFAKPRFQVYWNAVIVDTPEQALAGLQVAQSEKIFIEKRRGERLTLPAECATCAEAKPAIKVIEAQAMRYRVSVNMPREGWLFLADANYPGWEATVNGKAQPVYSAQVLGKAVRLQAGRNEVTIRYVPWSFYIGAAISAVTLLAMLSILFKRRCAWW